MRSRRYGGRANIGSDAVAFSTLVARGRKERGGSGVAGLREGRAAASRGGDVVQDF